MSSFNGFAIYNFDGKIIFSNKDSTWTIIERVVVDADASLDVELGPYYIGSTFSKIKVIRELINTLDRGVLGEEKRSGGTPSYQYTAYESRPHNYTLTDHLTLKITPNIGDDPEYSQSVDTFFTVLAK